MPLLVEQHYHVLTEIVMALNSQILKVIVREGFPSLVVGGHGSDAEKITERVKGRSVTVVLGQLPKLEMHAESTSRQTFIQQMLMSGLLLKRQLFR